MLQDHLWDEQAGHRGPARRIGGRRHHHHSLLRLPPGLHTTPASPSRSAAAASSPRAAAFGTCRAWWASPGRGLDAHGQALRCEEALDAGLVTSLHEPEDVLDAAYALARDIIANTSEVSTAVIKQMLNRLSGLDSPIPVARRGLPAHCRAPRTRDAVEGVNSFLEKRPPHFPLRCPRTCRSGCPGWSTESTP